MEHFFVNQLNNKSIIIGGVKILSDFTPEQIVVGVQGAFITVTGDGLRINRFDENEIHVNGKIKSITTERKR